MSSPGGVLLPNNAVDIIPTGIGASAGGGDAAASITSPSPAASAASPASAVALPSLTPGDSLYKPLDLPQATTPTVHPLARQQPVQNLGAASHAGAAAYIANQVLRGAIQGYDASRIQHAQQFNKKLSALSTLENQLGQQYVEAYNDVGSSRPGMTPDQILADPKVKQLHNQLLAVHQTTLQAIQSYLPAASPGGGSTKKSSKTSKQQQRNLLERMFGQDPDESLQAYSEAAQHLGPTAFYQVANPQQLNALYQQRQAGATHTATAATTEQNKLAYQNAVATMNQLGAIPPGKLTPAQQQSLDSARGVIATANNYGIEGGKFNTGRQEYQDYLYKKQTGAIPPDTSFEAYQSSQRSAGTAAGKPPNWSPSPNGDYLFDKNHPDRKAFRDDPNLTPEQQQLFASSDRMREMKKLDFTMKSGVANGHNVQAYYSVQHHGWVDSATGQVLPDFHPAPTTAELGSFTPVVSFDPATHQMYAGSYDHHTGRTTMQPVTGSVPLSAQAANELAKNIQPAAEADARYRLMVENAVDALKGNQQAMVSLLMNHIGMTLGAQKGSRINQSVIREAEESAPWTKTVYAKWGHWDPDGTWVYDGYKTGINLTGNQIQQMVQLGKERRDQQWRQAEEVGQMYGVPVEAPPLFGKRRAGAGTGAGAEGAGSSSSQTPHATAPAATTPAAVLPLAARAQLKPGHITTFKNGQRWTLNAQGNPEQVRP